MKACGCGAMIEARYRQCIRCRQTEDARKREGGGVPEVCACWMGRMRKTPWHCRCGRWKPAAAPVCEVCEVQVVQAA